MNGFEIPETDGEDGVNYTPKDEDENNIPDAAEQKSEHNIDVDMTSDKKFKDRTIGKILWKAGDIAKGKGTAGRLLDSALEIAPIPNPIRYAKEIGNNKKLKKLQRNQHVQNAAREAGFDFDELVDDSPDWVKPTIAIVFMVGVFVLIGMGILDVSFLKWLAETIIHSLIAG